DGTFQTTSRLTVKDWQTEDYTCIVQHKSLEEDIVVRVIEWEIRRNQDIETLGLLKALIIVVGVHYLLLLLLLALVVVRVVGVVVWWKKSDAARGPSMGVIIGCVGCVGVLLLALVLVVVGVVVWKKR
ncbi:hypothetical protein AAFF_G00386600, partial [Aldrovandia affinis]